ncbi:acyl-CoA dehydrogenase family protein [Mycolicibacterium holsaticum]|uniref:acyl-CoA dehydrogenase family protein n=1 Tax=Mycolicibacterium holsaticum TaxID=152142 RepID=UPI001C7E12C9|nr:acyl-CoA dehydrogenase family protein [Mycolicibacterium holsaticum]MDA4106942.1 acyl-CoA dehydrogenase [Mycolicibacterium holsaticum DSM 44478 = JCM 12374]QZA12376.1 acyl-CoA dehydrogenase family protein [Mycolicibacterium holsaticum DSM 44478 = JCM 12374]UNC10140.1 acyl-CoA dehydrogenase family protein [Mycolicibacterium holsaticum DSM 44478 = JCM 12374]
MDLKPTAQHEAFRGEVRDWLAANKPALPLPSGDTIDGAPAHLAWERKLYNARLAVVSWPQRFGGRDLDLWHWLIFEEEYYRAGLPQRVAQNGIFLLAPSLLEFGTNDQQERFLRRIASVADIWCQGWSEPDAGSDLASLRSRALRDEKGGGWRLEGQKCWTTRAAISTHMFGIFRTGELAQRHHGLTYFLIDLDQPSVTVQPVNKFDGTEGFADVYFDGAFVADSDVLGGVGNGWQVAMATTGSERSLTLRSPGRFLATADRLIEQFRAAPETVRADARHRAAVADAWMGAQAYKLATDWAVTRLLDGVPLGAEASLSKLFWSELDIELHQAGLVLQGSDADLDDHWIKGFQFALSGPIYAGTNEIQRNIVAERLLGIPRR